MPSNCLTCYFDLVISAMEGQLLRSTSPLVSDGSSMNLPSFRPLTHSLVANKMDLKIQVPVENTGSNGALEDVLGDPIDIQTQSQYNFDTITHLPTPVVNHGQFQNYQIEVQKRRPHAEKSVADSHSNRVVSEFDPRLRTAAVVERGRNFSNPAELSHELMPLPPVEVENAQFVGNTFHAPHIGDFMFDQIVGTGAFSTVVLARSNNKAVAVKIVSVPTDSAHEVSNFRLYICRELGILAHVRHPCIVELLDYDVNLSITEADIDQTFSGTLPLPASGTEMYDLQNLKAQNKQYFYLGYCEGGNLFQWLYQHHSILSGKVAFWRLMARVVAELAVAISYLHSHDVVHRDIKLENVLLNQQQYILDVQDPRTREDPLCTLTDFGLSKKLERPDQLLSTKCGSLDYVSPELLMGLEYNGKLLDSWALGLLIYAILEDRLPFDAPPLDYLSSSTVSPSVLKRRRNKHNPAHRIAMIDWEWYKVSALLKDETFPQEAKDIVKDLSSLVDVFLVRKDKRMLVLDIIDDPRFAWIKNSVPASFQAK